MERLWKVTNEIFLKLVTKINRRIYASGEAPNTEIEIDIGGSLIQIWSSGCRRFQYRLRLFNTVIGIDWVFRAGKRAGIKKFVHVLTGHGYKERKVIIEKFWYYNLILLKNLTFSHKDLLFKAY